MNSINLIISYMIAHPVAALDVLVCVALSFHGICAINKMTKHTPLIYWAGYALLTCGAFAVAIGPFYWHWTRNIGEVSLNAGVLIIACWREWVRSRRKDYVA